VRGLSLKILLLLFGLWAATMAVALPLASLPDQAGGRILVVFPPSLPADARLLAIVEAEGRPVLPMLGGLAWLAQSDDESRGDGSGGNGSGAAGFVGRLKDAGAWAAFHPDVFAVLPDGGCFYISVRKPGPPQPHPPI